MAADFRFKQFILTQGQSAFKLGTDSVLLGCWVQANQPKTALDIGAGTGVLSLIMAQRFAEVRITAIEMDQGSVMDCTNNFAHSIWKDRLSIIHQDVLPWSQLHISRKFDLIITNPPYFMRSLQSDDERKMNARHTDTLSHSNLAKLVKSHLSAGGKFACILPPVEFAGFTFELLKHGLVLNKVLRVSSFWGSPIIRELGEFSWVETPTVEVQAFIYDENHSRSEWYAELTKEFYVK